MWMLYSAVFWPHKEHKKGELISLQLSVSRLLIKCISFNSGTAAIFCIV